METGEELEDEAEYFINAGGVLNNFKWPDIPGLHDFKGKLMHSAAYEEGYDLKDKKVAVVGAGSSGVQIVARIQPHVQQLFVRLSRLHIYRQLLTMVLALDPLTHLDHSRIRPNVGRQRRRQLRIQRRAEAIPQRQSREVSRVPKAGRERTQSTIQVHHQG